MDSGDSEIRIYFNEQNLPEVGKIVGILTTNRDVPWDKGNKKAPDNWDYNIILNGKLKNKNCSLLKANTLLQKYRSQFGYDSVQKIKIEKEEINVKQVKESKPRKA